MSPAGRYFAWMYARAFVWVLLCAWSLRRATGNEKVSLAFFSAHLAALGFGIAVDLGLFWLAPPEYLTNRVLQGIFLLPIVIFTGISLWIGNWGKPVTVADVFLTLVPIILWGLLVIHGWEDAWDGHVLGAWFASAAAGGVDLYARYGPPLATRRPALTRLAAYPLVVLAVYCVLPRTE